jgi:hypothetical protein
MNSLSNLKLFLRECISNDKKRIKLFVYRSIEAYENFEFFRLRSKCISIKLNFFRNQSLD